MRKRTIRANIIASVVVIVILIIFVTQVVSSITIARTLNEDTEKYISAQATAYANEMNAFLERESTKMYDIKTGLEYIGSTDKEVVTDYIEEHYLANLDTVLNY